MSDSRWNATKHGLTSKRLLLPGEDAAELEELLEALGEQYQPKTALHCTFVVEAARSLWVLARNNKRYDEIEQTLHREEPDSTKWTDEQWHRLDVRARYRTTAERSCTRNFRNLAHIPRAAEAPAKPKQEQPKEEKKKAAEEPASELPAGGPPPLYQRIVAGRAYPTNEQLRKVTDDVQPETKLARIFEFPDGSQCRYQIDVESWRRLIEIEEAG